MKNLDIFRNGSIFFEIDMENNFSKLEHFLETINY